MPSFQPGSSEGTSVEDRLFRECVSMTKFALSKGIKVPSSIVNLVGNREKALATGQDTSHGLTELTKVHNLLADLVAPIRPGTCHLIIEEAEQKKWWHIFGAVPMVRRMAFVAIASLVGMLAISLSPDVSGKALGEGLLRNEGNVLLQNLLFLLSAASLGASFALLFKLNTELQNGGYEKDDDSSYFATWIMGLAAGMILAEVVPLNLFDGGGTEMEDQEINKLILALIGGFASSMVYNILNTIVNALGSAFHRDNHEELSTEAKKVRAEMTSRHVTKNAELVNRINSLRQEIRDGGSNEKMDREMERLIQQVMGNEEFESD